VGGFDNAYTTAVNSDLTPDYIKAIPYPDPWNSPYYYAAATGGRDFGVASMGKNGVLEGGSAWTTVSVNTFAPVNTGCFENDIVWVDDGFVIKPEGKQAKCQ
jgi:hypothetical protein